jgi:Ca-activated chloride channel homolog
VAELTYGHYAKAVIGDADVNYALSAPLPGEDETIEVEREFDTWYDQGHWAALLVLPLLLLGFRKGLLLAVFVTCMLPAPPAHANVVTDVWDSLWQRSEQRGFDAIRYGEPEKAVVLFEDNQQWKSVAQYRSGDYAASLQGFRNDPSVTARYNEGNSLARLGEYEAALNQYNQVLSIHPDHEDALFNKELVERLLQEQQQDQQQQDQDQQSQANNDSSENEQDNQQQPQDQSEQEQASENSEQREQEESQADQQQDQEGQEQQTAEAQQDDATRDEKQEALEQWLRRVPDDPGGLLRRKFSHETKQRLRRGEYENRQGEKLW